MELAIPVPELPNVIPAHPCDGVSVKQKLFIFLSVLDIFVSDSKTT